MQDLNPGSQTPNRQYIYIYIYIKLRFHSPKFAKIETFIQLSLVIAWRYSKTPYTLHSVLSTGIAYLLHSAIDIEYSSWNMHRALLCLTLLRLWYQYLVESCGLFANIFSPALGQYFEFLRAREITMKITYLETAQTTKSLGFCILSCATSWFGLERNIKILINPQRNGLFCRKNKNENCNFLSFLNETAHVFKNNSLRKTLYPT